MKAIQGFIAVCFSCLLLGGLYIGSAILGYFFAILGIIFSVIFIVVGLVVMITYTIYEAIKHYSKN